MRVQFKLPLTATAWRCGGIWKLSDRTEAE